MKRWLAFIFMIIVAVAAFTPCCTDIESQQEHVTADRHDAQKGDDGCTCSPFFSCATCPGFVATVSPVSVPVPTEYHLQYFDVYGKHFPSTYVDAHWQPPRIA